MRAIYTGMGNVDPICDECAARCRPGTKFYDIPDDTCSFCWKNRNVASCIRCKTSTLYYGIWSVPRFEGKLGTGREQWDKFLGIIKVALCKQCFIDGWTLLHSYALGDQVIVFQGTKIWEYPKFSDADLLLKE
ncbi:MAG: hypothetical protein A2806_02375 [Candidatus Terrybacteria bacterium RIFCSPHIGHO2_01_FULL_48_17]|uniref:Uncharacterized protein n=1 Tax=Candidatus Terrybacteria bacterium RIFCSPHIGHO2_01_FULL_48_17 TaxID=1802362 RepID=A0A1G2PHQ7_9BACT|nr:MAG: hypothetical protein A2806_02375 [Candidatus Terrybacteria bacterium RIFCSPHIGHO2_01_FULL_48_17]OHA53588.1 MAG: hypothetical protein A3A30_00330 [Candidatus Terrybacteria bacterium RIFCSPLOWO2_01_FULL_48_14]